MGILHLNQRVDSRGFEATALGGRYLAGSYGGGAGTSQAGGGLVAGSVNELNSVYSIEAQAALSLFYGGDGFATVGYKIVPMGVNQQAPGSVGHRVYFTGSIQGSRLFFFPVYFSYSTTGASIIREVGGVSVSAKFVWWGFVVSGP